MNSSLPVSISTGSMPDLGGAGVAPANAGAGGDFNAMILQTSQARASQSAAVSSQGQVPAVSGESLPPGYQQASIEQEKSPQSVSGKQENIDGSDALSELKKFLEADVTAEYSLIQEKSAASTQAVATSALVGTPVSQGAAVSQMATEPLVTEVARVPVDEAPLSKAVHELVAASGAEKAPVTSDTAGQQQVVAAKDVSVSVAGEKTQQQVAQQTAVVEGAQNTAGVRQQNEGVLTPVAPITPVGDSPDQAERSVDPALINAQVSVAGRNAVTAADQQVTASPSDSLATALPQATGNVSAESLQNTQVVQLQVAQQSVESQAAKVMAPGAESVAVQAAGIAKSDAKQAVTPSVNGVGQSAAEENGLLKGLVADNKAGDNKGSPEGQKTFLAGAAGSDSLAKLQNSAFQLSEQLANQTANKTSTAAVSAEARVESFAESLTSSLAATGAARAEKVGAEPHQLQMQQGLRPGNPAWGQAVSDRVVWLASQNGKVAEIRLDPPELGSLNVKLEIKNEQVSVVFNTPHASVKESLEQSLPRLREMFAEQGLELADSSVEDQGSGQRENAQEREAVASAGYGADGEVDGESEVLVSQAEQSISMVDYYA